MFFMRFPIDAVFVGSSRGADGSAPCSSVASGPAAVDGICAAGPRRDSGVLELPVGTVDATGTVRGDRLRIG